MWKQKIELLLNRNKKLIQKLLPLFVNESMKILNLNFLKTL